MCSPKEPTETFKLYVSAWCVFNQTSAVKATQADLLEGPSINTQNVFKASIREVFKGVKQCVTYQKEMSQSSLNVSDLVQKIIQKLINLQTDLSMYLMQSEVMSNSKVS